MTASGHAGSIVNKSVAFFTLYSESAVFSAVVLPMVLRCMRTVGAGAAMTLTVRATAISSSSAGVRPTALSIGLA